SAIASLTAGGALAAGGWRDVARRWASIESISSSVFGGAGAVAAAGVVRGGVGGGGRGATPGGGGARSRSVGASVGVCFAGSAGNDPADGGENLLHRGLLTLRRLRHWPRPPQTGRGPSPSS